MNAPSPSARDAATKIVRVLHDAGQVAYFAGGCVRDELMGLEPQDYDVATDAPPEKVRQLFHHSRFVGEAFGVVLVRLMGHAVEVATFRTEWGYQDGRRPAHVAFTDAEHDARRRDFTINGLFEDPLAEEAGKRVIDYVGGREDLERKVLRAIGDPDERFGEDYLRMLRAVRFAARLGFTLEERTTRAIRFHARQLSQISRERIGQEVRLMMSHPARATAARLAQELQLDGPALHEDSLHAGTAVTAALPMDATYSAALASWMLDRHFLHTHPHPAPPVSSPSPLEGAAGDLEAFATGKAPDVVRRWRRALCLSNEERDALQAVFALLPRAAAWPTLSVAARKRLLAAAGWGDTATLLRAAMPVLGAEGLVHRIDVESRPLLDEGVAPEPLINGEDIVLLGRRPGPEFRRLLDAAYDAQLEGLVTRRDEALAWLRRQV